MKLKWKIWFQNNLKLFLNLNKIDVIANANNTITTKILILRFTRDLSKMQTIEMFILQLSMINYSLSKLKIMFYKLIILISMSILTCK